MDIKIGLLLLFVATPILFGYSVFAEDTLDDIYSDCGEIAEIPGDLRTKIPWTVGIFWIQDFKNPEVFIASGTIVGPSLVLTLIGESSSSNYTFLLKRDLYVASAIKTTKILQFDSRTQLLSVDYVVPYTQVTNEHPLGTWYLLHLRTPFNLETPYTRAICLPTQQKYRELIGSQSLATVSSLQSEEFLTGFAPSVNSSTGLELSMVAVNRLAQNLCARLYDIQYKIRPTSSCRHTQAETSNKSCLSMGSTLVKFHDNRWFAIGINAYMPVLEESCSEQSVYIISGSSPSSYETINWTVKMNKCSPRFACDDGSCITPNKICNGVQSCSDNSDEIPEHCRAQRQSSCRSRKKKHMCGINGVCIRQDQLCDKRINCDDGSDEQQPECFRLGILDGLTNLNSQKTCPRVPYSKGVIQECIDSNYQRINCTAAKETSEMTLGCDKKFTSLYRAAYHTMKCLNGTWKPFRQFFCRLDCGVVGGREVQPFILHGQPANSTAFPWHAAIFKKNVQNQYSYICGASLIDTSVLLSAAHCLTSEFGTPEHKSLFKIVLSPISSRYEDNILNLNQTSQIFSVDRFWIPASYNPQTFTSDIAVIKLNVPARLSNRIIPVCHLLSEAIKLPEPGTFGKVPGFGLTENNEIAVELKFANLPIISPEECPEQSSSLFCAGYKNGTRPCLGDSGSGLVISVDRSAGAGIKSAFVLKGIVSHGAKSREGVCHKDNYVTFTHVNSFHDWISDILDTVDYEEESLKAEV